MKHPINTVCPYCSATATIAHGHTSDQSKVGPAPGDIGICEACGMVNVFDDNLKFRKPTEAEDQALRTDPQVMSARKVIHRMKH